MEHKYIIEDISENADWYRQIEPLVKEQVEYHKNLSSPDPDMFGEDYNVQAEYMKAEKEAEDFACFVAYDETDPDKLIGMATLFEFDEYPTYPYSVGYIFDVHVKENQRGAGLGHILMDRAMEWFAAHPNIRSITLEAWAGNERVQKLYRQYGFEIRDYEMTVLNPTWKKQS